MFCHQIDNKKGKLICISNLGSFLQSKEDSIEHLQKHGLGRKTTPILLASHLESPEALFVLLRHLQGICNKDMKEGNLRAEIMKIIHISTAEKNLMRSILENRQLFGAHSFLHQIENYIHESNSIAIKAQYI